MNKLIVVSKSMSPFLRVGDILYLDAITKDDFVSTTNVYVYEDLLDKKVIHRLSKIQNNSLHFKGDNNCYIDRPIDLKALKFKLLAIERDEVKLSSDEFLFKLINRYSMYRGNLKYLLHNIKIKIYSISCTNRLFNSLIGAINRFLVIFLQILLKIMLPNATLRLSRGRCLWKKYELMSDLDFILSAPQEKKNSVRLFISIYIFLKKLYPLLGEVNFISTEKLNDFLLYGAPKQRISFNSMITIKKFTDHFLITGELLAAYETLSKQLYICLMKNELHVKNQYEILKAFIDILRLATSLEEKKYLTRIDYMNGKYQYSKWCIERYDNLSIVQQEDLCFILKSLTQISFDSEYLHEENNKTVHKQEIYIEASIETIDDLIKFFKQYEDKVFLPATLFKMYQFFINSIKEPEYKDYCEKTIYFYRTDYITFYEASGDKERIKQMLDDSAEMIKEFNLN